MILNFGFGLILDFGMDWNGFWNEFRIGFWISDLIWYWIWHWIGCHIGFDFGFDCGDWKQIKPHKVKKKDLIWFWIWLDFGLDWIQNCAARLVLKKKKSDHITPIFCTLHCLPIRSRIIYKLNTLCHKCIINSAPEYLCSCLHLYTPSRTLRSSSDTLTLKIPRTKLSSACQRAFTSAGPSTWNQLPLTLKDKYQPTTHLNAN